jgi:dienelactone hydrolase
MRTSLVLSASCVTLLALVAPAQAASRSYAASGSLATEAKTLDASTQVVVPTTGGPYPLLVASHGWSASGQNQMGWAAHFASWGFVVAVPTFPNPLSPDADVDAGIIRSLVAKLSGGQAATYHVKPGPFGVEGHSAGGLATTVAATNATMAPAAVVLFDPVDSAAKGKGAYATLCAPTLAIFAESSSCNNNADWSTFASSTTAELVRFKVKGSTHCDGENDARALCGPFCGGAADPDRQKVYAHYATAFFLSKLTGDAAAATALAEAQTDTDLTDAASSKGTCAPASDTPSPAPTADPNAAPTSSASPPATSPSSPAAANAPAGPDAASGCACRAAAVPARTDATRSSVPAALALGLALASLRRRHPRHARHAPHARG